LENKENLTVEEDLLLKALENDENLFIQKRNKSKYLRSE
jgi:hypothetical protein